MSAHDVLLVDLDGTVYRGQEPIEGAVEALDGARSRGVPVGYVTNNASRRPDAVADQLAALGLTLTVDDVVTSAQAAASLLAGQCDSGASVLVVGTDALADEIRHVGLTPVREATDDPVAVVQGHSPETGWAQLAEAMLAIEAGAVWVACNVDVTLPTERGLLPGNGAMVTALRAATGREPQVAGKPAAPLLEQAVARYGADSPLIIGDRLDTDIAGAHTIGAESLLVLTGVSTAADLLAADSAARPTYVAGDLGALADLGSSRVPDGDTDHVEDAGWTVRVEDGVLELAGNPASGDRVAALRALCAVGWRSGLSTVRSTDDVATDAVTTLGLPRA